MPNPNSPSDPAHEQPKPAARRDSSESLERLLAGAQVTFAERGYHAANVHEICARSNVGIGTFYAHFAHKRDLLRRVFAGLVAVPPADALLDHDRLVATLGRAADDPKVAGLVRAWYEAVLDEPDLARFQAEWRPAYLVDLAATIVEARTRKKIERARHDPAVVAWTIATLSRETSIHDRTGLPDLDALARLFEELMFRAQG